MVPVFAGCPVPNACRSNAVAENCKILCVYFHPWVLDRALSSEYVPFAGELAPKGNAGSAPAWDVALSTWLRKGVLCSEVAHALQNMTCVYRTRPKETKGDESDQDDVVSDAPILASVA